MKKMYANNRSQIIVLNNSFTRGRQAYSGTLHNMKISSHKFYSLVLLIRESKSEDNLVGEK